VPLVLSLLLVAAPSNPYLEEARGLIRAVRFSEALERLDIARQVPELSLADKVEMLELTARCDVALGRGADASHAYAELLTLEPSFVPDASLAPKLREVFDEAKAKLYAPDYLKLVREAAPSGWVRVRVLDPWQRARSFTARAGDGPDVKVTLEEHVASFEVEAAQHALTWSLEAHAENGDVLASAHGEVRALPPLPVAPRVGAAPSAEPAAAVTSRWTRPAPWVSTVVAAVAAAIGLGLQLNAQELWRQAHAPGAWVDEAALNAARAKTESQAAVGLFIGAGAAAVFTVVGFAW
jgi:hypothetical protein